MSTEARILLAALRAQTTANSTESLVASLAVLRASAPLDEARRIVQSMIVDVLTDRIPSLIDAVDAWIEDDDTPFDTPADVVLDALSHISI